MSDKMTDELEFKKILEVASLGEGKQQDIVNGIHKYR